MFCAIFKIHATFGLVRHHAKQQRGGKATTYLQSFHSMTPRQCCKPARFCQVCSQSRNLKTPYLAVVG